MARPKKKSTSVSHLLVPEEPKTEWQKILAHLEENIKLYAAGAVFILICLAIGALIRVNAVVKEKEVATKYVEAALEQEAKPRLEKYKAISESAGKWTPEVLYMMGETALEAGEKETARQAFDKVISEYGDSDFAAPAMEGLAFLARDEDRLEDALKMYEDLISKWPGAYVARCAHVTIGELLEALDRPQEAISAYRKQITVFPESSVATKAEQALDRMAAAYPDLFPAEEGEGEDATPAEAGVADGAADAAQTGSLTVEPQAAPADE
ncbi:MAG: Outer membrane protein assembly factor BamD [Candidatus Hydrogenedentes bacterium ADurb.Bin101]|jgi:tetratricopeptide (TPR) repeat protein|nr:MAG: Outer membrane protein assembly factor BamD [Candidatus Hydrogenedentes bacterium ADurb.Bin101]HOC67658.1 tetratricopeptide repeat protein [Candidatus Hydrogenedentota bacterium]